MDSLYFSVVTFTTVGYGDLAPTTEAGKLFAIFFSFAGISIVGALLGYVGGSIVEAEREAIRKTRIAARTAMMDMFHPKKMEGVRKAKVRLIRLLGGNKEEDLEVTGDNRLPGLDILRNIFSHHFAIRTRHDSSKSFLRRILDTIAQCYYVFVPFVALALIIGKIEGWTMVTTSYYALATASTVGWGDVAPVHPQMRLLSLAFIPLAVISLGEILGRIAGYFIRKETKRAEREFMDRKITFADLEAMDIDGDGEVDLFEYLSFMLSAMGKVEREMMYELRDLFKSLDETGSNSIQKEDLMLIAKKRKRDPWSVRRKKMQ